MGMIRIQTFGSFPQRVGEFSAMQHGHAQAVAEAIAWLSTVVLPAAIAQDHQLHTEGAAPAQGWRRPPVPPSSTLHELERIAGPNLMFKAPGRVVRVFEGTAHDHPGIGIVELPVLQVSDEAEFRSTTLEPGSCAAYGDLVRLANAPTFPMSALLQEAPKR